MNQFEGFFELKQNNHSYLCVRQTNMENFTKKNFNQDYPPTQPNFCTREQRNTTHVDCASLPTLQQRFALL